MTNLVRENHSTAALNPRDAEKFITPPASISESADGYSLELEMPGVGDPGRK